MKAIWRSDFFIKLRSWEYWPWYVVYFPVALYWLRLSLKARSFFFFSAANPRMKCGGLLGESKKKILEMIPEKYVPITLLFNPGVSLEDVIITMKNNKLNFPVIAKPDIGERGILVKKINNSQELEVYITNAKFQFQIQEYLASPIELGIFYYRFPRSEQGAISSVVEKSMLTVTGDGNSTLKQLIWNSDRAKLQLKELKGQIDFGEILPNGEKKELVSIGNHCKGTTFLDANRLINDKLVQVFDRIFEQMDGVYYGRFDLRCDTYEDLYKGTFKVMELNGAAAEPAHIYQPGFSLFKGVGTLIKHWDILCEISMANHKLGIPYLEASKGWSMLHDHLKSDKYISGQLA